MSSRYEENMKTKPYLPFHISHLPEEIIEKARKELNETEEARAMGLAELKELIQTEKKLQGYTDDAFLFKFLRPRKFDVDRAFKLYKNFYGGKKDYAEIYGYCDVDKIKAFFRNGVATILPYRDAEGCAVLILEIGKWNAADFDIPTVFQAFALLILFMVEDVASQVCGIRIMFNTAGTNLRQLRCVTPRYLQMIARAVKNSMPARFKGIHFYNESTIFQYLWAILKVFLTDKIRQRVHFHGNNVKHLHSIIPKDILTKDYGGENLHFNSIEWLELEIESFYETFVSIIRTGYKD